MNKEIIYDFGLSKKVSEELKNIAEKIDSKIIKKKLDDETLFASSWIGENADAFFAKYRALIGNFELIKNDILIQNEEIEKTSRHVFLLEQEAKELMNETKK